MKAITQLSFNLRAFCITIFYYDIIHTFFSCNDILTLSNYRVTVDLTITECPQNKTHTQKNYFAYNANLPSSIYEVHFNKSDGYPQSPQLIGVHTTSLFKQKLSVILIACYMGAADCVWKKHL